MPPTRFAFYLPLAHMVTFPRWCWSWSFYLTLASSLPFFYFLLLSFRIELFSLLRHVPLHTAERSRQFTRINEALDILRPMPPSTSPRDSELAVAVSSNVEYVSAALALTLFDKQSVSVLPNALEH